MQDVLLPHEIEWLERQQHLPTAVTQVMPAFIPGMLFYFRLMPVDISTWRL